MSKRAPRLPPFFLAAVERPKGSARVGEFVGESEQFPKPRRGQGRLSSRSSCAAAVSRSIAGSRERTDSRVKTAASSAPSASPSEARRGARARNRAALMSPPSSGLVTVTVLTDHGPWSSVKTVHGSVQNSNIALREALANRWLL
jgi:hypothetical protein